MIMAILTDNVFCWTVKIVSQIVILICSSLEECMTQNIKEKKARIEKRKEKREEKS